MRLPQGKRKEEKKERSPKGRCLLRTLPRNIYMIMIHIPLYIPGYGQDFNCFVSKGKRKTTQPPLQGGQKAFLITILIVQGVAHSSNNVNMTGHAHTYRKTFVFNQSYRHTHITHCVCLIHEINAKTQLNTYAHTRRTSLCPQTYYSKSVTSPNTITASPDV